MAQTDFDPYALFDALRAGGDVDKIRSSVEFVLQALIEVEATEAIGAAPSEWKRRQAARYRSQDRRAG